MRTITRWMGTLLCVAFALAFFYSLRRSVDWTSTDLQHQVTLVPGALVFGWRPDGWQADQYAGEPGWGVGGWGWGPPPIEWRFAFFRNRSWEGWTIPLWTPLATIAIPTGILWFLDRRKVAQRVRHLKRRIRPKRRRRVTLKLVALFFVIHFVGLFLGFEGFDKLYYFFATQNSSDWLASEWSKRVIGGLVFGAPFWVALWAWLFVRFLNHLVKTIPASTCDCCGYELAGNTSGICPECGEKVNLADLDIQQASTS